MRYRSLPAFEQRLRKLDPSRKARVTLALERVVAFFETGDLPAGLGLKPLRRDLWEVRAGLLDRMLFHREGDLIEWLIVGTHDEIRRFLNTL